jgi:transcription elongation factor Elf1
MKTIQNSKCLTGKIRRKRCPNCNSLSTKKNGKTVTKKTRYRCNNCGKSFYIEIQQKMSIRNEKLFTDWVEGLSIRKLSLSYNLDKKQVHRIILDKLKNDPPIERELLEKAKFIQFDGKYIHGRKRSILLIMNSETRLPIACNVEGREALSTMIPWFEELKKNGLNPYGATVDGFHQIEIALKKIWPDIIIQRCLFHISMQVYSWCRIPPRTELGAKLTELMGILRLVYNDEKAVLFNAKFDEFLSNNSRVIKNLNSKIRVEKDLKRAIGMIKRAQANMFNFLRYPDQLSNTTGVTEGYNKKIQRALAYNHCGLTLEHKTQFLKWLIYHDRIRKTEE